MVPFDLISQCSLDRISIVELFDFVFCEQVVLLDELLHFDDVLNHSLQAETRLVLCLGVRVVEARDVRTFDFLVLEPVRQVLPLFLVVCNLRVRVDDLCSKSIKLLEKRGCGKSHSCLLLCL